jgi:hypothetical protein
MSKVRFETSGALGFVILANPPLNLFDLELIEDLRTAVNQARRHGRASLKNPESDIAPLRQPGRLS